MNENIFDELNDFYHKKTFDKNWPLDCGNGNKKLDEIQIFLHFLKNKKEKIENVDFFDQNFKYKENDIAEPGDLKYRGQIFQITHGNISNYQNFQKNKNDRIRNNLLEAFILPAKDIIMSNLKRYEYYIQDLGEKEKSAEDNIILLVRIDRRNSLDPEYKAETKWQDVIFVFDDKNISIKNSS